MKNRGLILGGVFFVAAGLILLMFLSPDKEGRKKTAEGIAAPALLLAEPLTGRAIPASEFSGKVLFVNFWASWCQPCKEEMPSLEALYREMAHTADFRIVTILYKDSPSSALEYMKSQGFSFPVYVDQDGGSAKKFGVTGVPETYIVDKNGVLVKKIIGGFDWNAPEVKSFIQSLLK
ncbi:MAG: TlpA family protein disulfide reductase [Nitrospirae bacterium]|nr:MAG: TlpA family protein disulfide reductase [Nitrospirota bacterium]